MIVRTACATLMWMAASMAVAGQASGDTAAHGDGLEFERVQRLLDLSGLAWLGDDLFLAVHDAKTPEEDELPRVSLLRLPQSLEGLTWLPLDISFPGGSSNDLESASRVPGTDLVLLVESADDASRYQRLFLGEVIDGGLEIRASVLWSDFTEVFNIEATAVASSDSGHVFLWAERASGQQTTSINWAPLLLNPFAIGPVAGSVPVTLPDDLRSATGAPLYSRPAVALDIGPDGLIYMAASFDPEGTVLDPDNGPFRSVVMTIGSVVDGDVVLNAVPSVIGSVDGLKVESIAVRVRDGATEIFIGTDDENYGGTLRALPLVSVE